MATARLGDAPCRRFTQRWWRGGGLDVGTRACQWLVILGAVSTALLGLGHEVFVDPAGPLRLLGVGSGQIDLAQIDRDPHALLTPADLAVLIVHQRGVVRLG